MRCASGHKVTALRRAISDEDYRLLKGKALRVPIWGPRHGYAVVGRGGNAMRLRSQGDRTSQSHFRRKDLHFFLIKFAHVRFLL